MRTFLCSFIKCSQFKCYFSPYFAPAGFMEEMGAQKVRPAAKKAPGVTESFFWQRTVIIMIKQVIQAIEEANEVFTSFWDTKTARPSILPTH